MRSERVRRAGGSAPRRPARRRTSRRTRAADIGPTAQVPHKRDTSRSPWRAVSPRARRAPRAARRPPASPERPGGVHAPQGFVARQRHRSVRPLFAPNASRVENGNAAGSDCPNVTSYGHPSSRRSRSTSWIWRSVTAAAGPSRVTARRFDLALDRAPTTRGLVPSRRAPRHERVRGARRRPPCRHSRAPRPRCASARASWRASSASP